MDTLKGLGKSLLGIAPAIAGVLVPGVGGPIAGTALKALSKAVGIDAKDGEDLGKKLTTALSGGLTPEQLAAVKKADNEFQVQMKELDIDLAKVHAGDRDSAREMQIKTRGWTGPALAGLVMLSFIAAVVGVFYLAVDDQPLDASVSTLVGAVVGYASAKADQLCSFYWGSSEGNDQAQQHLADAAKGR